MDCLLSNRTEVVYKINCKNCSASYIGQTKRHLSIRVKEHFNNIKMHASNLSVISKHKLEFNHDFDWSAPNSLHNEKHIRKREIAEMFFIKKFDNTINSKKDTENLNNIMCVNTMSSALPARRRFHFRKNKLT
ncbi:hypothetical protein ACFW04_014610 [Cataglyphis niger]